MNRSFPLNHFHTSTPLYGVLIRTIVYNIFTSSTSAVWYCLYYPFSRITLIQTSALSHFSSKNHERTNVSQLLTTYELLVTNWNTGTNVVAVIRLGTLYAFPIPQSGSTKNHLESLNVQGANSTSGYLDARIAVVSNDMSSSARSVVLSRVWTHSVNGCGRTLIMLYALLFTSHWHELLTPW